MGGQIVIHYLKSLHPIVIVGIDDSKRSINQILCGKDCMAGSPRFFAVFRNFKSCRQDVQLLKRIFYFHDFGNAIANCSTECFLDFMLDDKNDSPKSGAICVVKRIINNDFPIRTNRVNLLHSSISAAHTCSHDN